MASIKLTPAIKAVIAESSRVCFGNLPIVNFRTGFKTLKQKPWGSIAEQYYMPDYRKDFRKFSSNFKTEAEERRADQLVRFKRQGKAPPKKGQGKRSKKKR